MSRREEAAVLFVGDDWAEAFHEVVVLDGEGVVLGGARFSHDVVGVGGFHELVTSFGVDSGEVVIGIETDRGLWVESLVAAGYRVYAINPLAASRYRDRHTVSGAKSDAGDARVLADLVRTDRHVHRLVAADSDLVEAVQVLARAHVNLIRERVRHSNTLRAALRDYYPGALEAFESLTHRDAVAVLGRAPTPVEGHRLSRSQIVAVLRRGGRQRNLDKRAGEIQGALRVPQLEASTVVTAAYGATTRATVGLIRELNAQISDLETRLSDHFEQHPDAGIYLSQPGLGDVLGARVLSEFGDDPNRYSDVKSRRNYAGTSPITIASGSYRNVQARHIRNRRLITAIDQWAFAALRASPGARAFYDQHRTKGDSHHQALRALGNRLVGILHGCLKHQTLYNENTAWGHRQPANLKQAA
jgi:transposase